MSMIVADELRRIVKLRIGDYKSKVHFDCLVENLTIPQLLVIIESELFDLQHKTKQLNAN